jgi:hypothetical protein
VDKVTDFFPNNQTQSYEYEAFEMVLPQRPQDGFVDVIKDSPGFQTRFLEVYTASTERLMAVSLRSGAELATEYRVLPTGLFAFDPIKRQEHCTIPLPLKAGTSFTTLYGTTKIGEVGDEELWVVEDLVEDTKGHVKTLYKLHAWIEYQEVETDILRYVVRRVTQRPNKL